MANFLTNWFAPTINAAVQAQMTALAPGMQLSTVKGYVANLYNESVFQWIGQNQIIIDFEDKVKLIANGYQSNADVYTCIDLITKKIAECAYTLFEIKSGVTQKQIKMYENLCMSDDIQSRFRAMQLKEQIFEEIDQNPILDLLANPNPLQNYEEWVSDLAAFYLLVGDGYMFGNAPSESQIENRIWTQLYSLPSHYMQIISGGMFNPVAGYKLAQTYTTEVPIPANQVHHFKTFNPDFTVTGASLYGQSPLRAVYRNILKQNQGSDELLKQMRNGGAMGFISPEGDGQTLTKTQLDLLKDKLVSAKDGETLMDRIFPSTGPLKWTQIGLPSTDLQLIESLNLDTKKIYSAYHVPMIFSGSEEASNMSNVSSAPKQLIYNAVAPISRKIRDAINAFVCRPYAREYGKKYYFDYDLSSYPEMSDDMGKLSDWLDKSPEITLNERRVAKGYDRITDPLMDKIYINSSFVPLEDLSLDSAYNNASIKNQISQNVAKTS